MGRFAQASACRLFVALTTCQGRRGDRYPELCVHPARRFLWLLSRQTVKNADQADVVGRPVRHTVAVYAAASILSFVAFRSRAGGMPNMRAYSRVN